MALELVDDLGACLLVAANDVTEVLRVQSLGKRRRAHQITEHNRELPPLGALRAAGRGV
jgi:hypothetical protein